MTKTLKNIVPSNSARLKSPPSSTDRPSTNNQYFAFSLTYNQNREKYSIVNCDVINKCAFIRKINTLSQQNWQDVTFRNKKYNGLEYIPKNIIACQPPSIATDEVEYMVIRCNGDAARIVGMRVGRVFEIFWYDPDLTLYDH